MNPFKFLFHLVTLGMFRKFKGARVQSGIRRYIIESTLPRFGCPTKPEIEDFIGRWFSEGEVKYVMYFMTNSRFFQCYFETDKDAACFLDQFEDLFQTDQSLATGPVKISPGHVYLGEDRGYTSLDNLAWCNECDLIVAINNDFGDIPDRCYECDSEDILPFNDMKPKEVEKHVKKAAA